MRIIKDFINKFLKNSSDDQPWLSYYNKEDNTIKITILKSKNIKNGFKTRIFVSAKIIAG